MKNCNYKIRFSRTTQKSECISVKGPKLWNDLSADIKLCKSTFTFLKMYKALLLQPLQHFSVCTKLFYNVLQRVTSSSMFERGTVLSHCYCTDSVSIS